MTPESRTQRSPCINPRADPTREEDELAGQGPVPKFNAGSDEALIKAPTPPKAPITPLVLPSTKNLFTKFIKVFMETTQTQAQALAEPQERSLKARSLKTYLGKSHIDCYQFYQQCENYFKTSGAIEMNCTLFTASFFRDTISFRLAQHNRRH